MSKELLIELLTSAQETVESMTDPEVENMPLAAVWDYVEIAIKCAEELDEC